MPGNMMFRALRWMGLIIARQKDVATPVLLKKNAFAYMPNSAEANFRKYF